VRLTLKGLSSIVICNGASWKLCLRTDCSGGLFRGSTFTWAARTWDWARQELCAEKKSKTYSQRQETRWSRQVTYHHHQTEILKLKNYPPSICHHIPIVNFGNNLSIHPFIAAHLTFQSFTSSPPSFHLCSSHSHSHYPSSYYYYQQNPSPYNKDANATPTPSGAQAYQQHRHEAVVPSP
jgi:hypothetical protein